MLLRFLYGSMFALPGLMVIGLSTLAPEPISLIVLVIGLLLTIALPAWMIFRKRRASGSGGTGQSAEVTRRLALVDRFSTRFSGVGGIRIDKSLLTDLAQAEGTDQLWPQIEAAVNETNTHTANSKARIALDTAKRYKLTD